MELDRNIKLLDYFKKISEVTSIKIDDKNILRDNLNKIKKVDSDIALNYYINPNSFNNKNIDNNIFIFPFGSNKSQIEAVSNAINNKMSVIEGPPGTGKTQTILNIIANLIIRNKTCQIVSNNNSAIENVENKLKDYMLDFFVAKMGSNSNKENFIENQKDLVDLSEFKDVNLNELKKNINNLSSILINIYDYEIELAKLKKDLIDINTEYNYFLTYMNDNNKELKYLVCKREKLLKVYNEYILLDKINFFKKLKYIYLYGIGNFTFFKQDKQEIMDIFNNSIYKYNIEYMTNKIDEMSVYIKDNLHYKEEYEKLSMLYLKKWLYNRYKSGRKKYELKNIKYDYDNFIKDYPIILSTTYSSKNTFNPDAIFDYVIMDESSQIDIVTGSLALSTAKNAVIIGDEKQLPNVVTKEDKIKTNEIFKSFDIEDCYSYCNSLLTSIKNCIKDIPITLLKEHYRCHPKIIDFCNKEFYDNKLVIMTKDNNEENVIKVIRTSIGNHSRDKVNQREIDVIKDLLNKEKLTDIGIIAPYNNQVKELKKEFPNVEVNTVHKYQGREKDTIIISTVDDKITDFVNDPHILNVAISRAKKKLYLIITGNNIDNTYIKDLIDYVKYNSYEIENSKIYSIFDFLYKQYEDDRIKMLKTKVSNYDSENLMYLLIKKELSNRNNLDVIIHYPLNMLIKDKSLLNSEEEKFIKNGLSHFDFLIYNRVTKKTVLAIEVDGYNYHKEGTIQNKRDEIKNSIANKYNITMLRFKTNGSNEKEKLHNKLNQLLKMEVNINE